MKDSKNIQEEIKSLSAILDQLRANDAMKDMEQSFVDRESEILNAIQSASNKNSQSQDLFPNKLPYLECFAIPENYFETSEQAIIQKIKNNSHPVKTISFYKIFSYAVAASVIMLLGLTFVRYYTSAHQKGQTSSDTAIIKEMDSLPESEVLSYLQDSGTDVEAAMVASFSEDENLPSEEEILLNEDIFTNLNIQPSHQSENQKSSL